MKTGFMLTAIVVLTLSFIVGMMAGMPRYTVWQQEMSGKAEFAKAEQNRKIKVQEAKALKDSAVFRAEAEVVRARGVAEANKIIGKSLTNNEAYLRYLWVNALGEKDDVTTLYIPTEGQMPLMKGVK
jgi:regulator of protease activity HflC (stomatin/prohibitin superfamily)